MPKPSLLIVCTQCAAINRSPAARKLSAGKCGKCAAPLGTPKPIDLSDKTFAKLQARDQGPYVLDVWAPWCGPCKVMAPAYAASAAKFGGDVRFFKLNSEQFPNAAAGLNIKGIPALFYFDGGKIKSRKSGALPESAITQWITQERQG